MQHIVIEPTYKSPKVDFNPNNGVFKLEGKSILVDVEEFYRPLLNWMDNFAESTKLDKIEFSFDIEYFNLASTKRFMFFLIKLKDLQEKGTQVNVKWAYPSTDANVLEMG